MFKKHQVDCIWKRASAAFTRLTTCFSASLNLSAAVQQRLVTTTQPGLKNCASEKTGRRQKPQGARIDRLREVGCRVLNRSGVRVVLPGRLSVELGVAPILVVSIHVKNAQKTVHPKLIWCLKPPREKKKDVSNILAPTRALGGCRFEPCEALLSLKTLTKDGATLYYLLKKAWNYHPK